MSKRQSLKGKGIDSLLFGISENNKELKELAEQSSKVAVRKSVTREKRMEPTAEMERLTVPLKLSQVEALTSLERAIMKKRSREARKQRITKNSIIRACLDALLKLDFDTKDIPDEAELTRRIYEAIIS